MIITGHRRLLLAHAPAPCLVYLRIPKPCSLPVSVITAHAHIQLPAMPLITAYPHVQLRAMPLSTIAADAHVQLPVTGHALLHYHHPCTTTGHAIVHYLRPCPCTTTGHCPVQTSPSMPLLARPLSTIPKPCSLRATPLSASLCALHRISLSRFVFQSYCHFFSAHLVIVCGRFSAHRRHLSPSQPYRHLL